MRLGYTTRIRRSVGDPTLTEFFNSKIPKPGALWPAVCPSLQQYVSMHCQAPCHRLLPPSCAPESFSYPPSYFSLSLICNPPLPSCLLSCFVQFVQMRCLGIYAKLDRLSMWSSLQLHRSLFFEGTLQPSRPEWNVGTEWQKHRYDNICARHSLRTMMTFL